MLFLLVSRRAQALKDFTDGLADGGEVLIAPTPADGVELARTRKPDLVVVDHDLAGDGPGEGPLSLVMDLLAVNAMINTAVVSPLSDEEFHEWSEGLGILARVSMEPGRAEGEELAGRLRDLLG